MANIFLDYFYWHYTVAPFGILKIMRNYQIATGHKFLINKHLETLFDPWHRRNPSDLSSREQNFFYKIFDKLIDLYIRLIAAGIRMAIIAAGITGQLILLVVFLILLIIWLGWPVIALYSIKRGLTLL